MDKRKAAPVLFAFEFRALIRQHIVIGSGTVTLIEIGYIAGELEAVVDKLIKIVIN